MVHPFRYHEWKEEYEAKTEAKIQTMIQERQVKIQDVKHSVEISRKDEDTVIAGSVQIFTTLISRMKRSQAELIGVIKEKLKTTEKQAEGFIKDLKNEITQLEKKSSELNQPSHTVDHLHLLQNTKDWTKVNVHQSSHVGNVRTAVAQLEKILSQEKKKLCDVELRMINRYAVNVTLDPDTAHPGLILSDDGKQVYDGNIMKNLPNNTERFSYCVSVLGKQSFSSGRVYYEVQVKRKTKWSLGVARESINRNGLITLTPNNGVWTICLRNGNEFMANAVLPLRVRDIQKVGVFVDYEEGLVSFYDVEARVHIYSFTGCTFTEKLYPYFSPCLNNGGRKLCSSDHLSCQHGR